MGLTKIGPRMVVDQNGNNISNLFAEKANKKSNIVYVTDLIKSNPNTPIATVINRLFTDNKKSGIKVILDTDITINSTIIMQNNCLLEGATRKTQIKLANASNCDMINWNYSTRASVRNLTIDGNKTNNTLGNGIVCGGDKNSNGIVDSSLIENVDIWNCIDDGLKVLYPIWVINFNKIRIGYCDGYGLYNTGTDNFFSDIYIMSCGKKTTKAVGMWFYGSNNKLSNSKVIFSGLASVASSVGVQLSGSSQQIMNLEAQENLRAGIYLYYVNNSNINVLSDANADKVTHLSGVGYGVQLSGCTDNILNINTTNFCYSQGYYQDKELIIGTDNFRNTITFRYDKNNVNIPLQDTSSTPEDYNVINGYSLIHYIKLSKINKANIVTQPIPNGSTYWNLNSGITASDGLITASAQKQDISKLITFTAGKVYLARINFSSLTGGWLFRAENTTNFTSPTLYTFGNSMHMIIKQTTTANRNFLFRCNSFSGGTAQVDGIALIDITNEYNILKNYFGDGTIGRLLCTDPITTTVNL
ncbi:hypothetical protein [Bacillus sp. OTU2372]|uniref:hypothetical protein n=1 Tax=Bacillus sp. OTU2372 TaxID=3043858 RepID=UPI00313C79B4